MTSIIWKGETRTLDEMASRIEDLGIPGLPLIEPSINVCRGVVTPDDVSANAPPAGDLLQ